MGNTATLNGHRNGIVLIAGLNSAVGPLRRTLFDEGGDALVGVGGVHQLVHVELFQRGQEIAEHMVEFHTGGLHPEAQGGRALGQDLRNDEGFHVRFERCTVRNDSVHQADRMRLLRVDGAPGEQEVSGAREADLLRQPVDAGGGNTPSTICGCPSRAL